MDAPFQKHSITSKEAAQEIQPRAGTLRHKLFCFIRDKGQYGATDLEAQEEIPMAASTQRPRRVELEKAGLIEDSGETRRTKSGRQAVVWVERKGIGLGGPDRSKETTHQIGLF